MVKVLAKTDDEIKLKDKLMYDLSKQRKDLLGSLKAKKELKLALQQCNASKSRKETKILKAKSALELKDREMEMLRDNKEGEIELLKVEKMEDIKLLRKEKEKDLFAFSLKISEQN